MFSKIRCCKIQGYADDTQIYSGVDLNNLEGTAELINNDLQSILDYSTSHNLQLNSSKSYYMIFGTSQKVSDYVRTSLQLEIQGNTLSYTTKHKNLGIIIDNVLRYRDHVKMLLKRSYSALKLLYSNKQVI